MRTPHAAVIGVALLAVAPAQSARATYSIVASDTRTQQVGGAGASCVYPSQVSVIYGVAPGFGAVHAQAQSNAAGRDRAVQLLREGRSPNDILSAITAMSFDALAARRQYAVVDVMGRSAGFTGAQNMMFADDVQGGADGFVYSVQGNILTGATVLEQAAVAFEAAGCDLADRLMRALEAGAKGGEGDSRCTSASGIATNSAFIQVDLAGMPAGSYLKLSSGSGSRVDPLPDLRRSFDSWRATHPCTVRSGADAGALGSDASVAPLDASIADGAVVDGSSARDAEAPMETGGPGAAFEAGQSIDGSVSEARDASVTAASDAGLGGAPAPSTVSPAPSEHEFDSDGCSLGTTGAPRSGLGFMGVALALALRRRRRRAG